MKILVTGFDPFDGESVNPSWMAVDRLPDEMYGAQIIKRRLPVVYFKALDVLEGYIKEIKPDVILLSGQAGGADTIRVERVGLNLCEATIPDNDGVLLQGEPIDKDGPIAYYSTYPYRKIYAAVKEAGIPVKFSFSAGAYLCNHMLYGALHFAATKYPNIKAGFIHVPFLPEQVVNKPGVPSMPIDDIAKAMNITVGVIAQDK